jgi:hypothetical protein
MRDKNESTGHEADRAERYRAHLACAQQSRRLSSFEGVWLVRLTAPRRATNLATDTRASAIPSGPLDV